MYMKTYDISSVILILLIGSTLEAVACYANNIVFGLFSLIAVLTLFAIAILESWPFLSTESNEYGIYLCRFKEKIYFLDWSEVRTIGVLTTHGNSYVYASKMTRYELELRIQTWKERGCFIGAACKNECSINAVIWQKRKCSFADKRSVLLMGSGMNKAELQSAIHTLQLLNMQYIAKTGDTPVNLFSFGP